MQGPTNPFAVRMSNGAERQLRYPFNAAKRIKDKLGHSIFSLEGVEAITKNVEDNLPYVIWQGALKADPDVTLDQIGEEIEAHDIRRLLSELIPCLGGDPVPNGSAALARAANAERNSPLSDAGQSPDTTSDSQTETSGS